MKKWGFRSIERQFLSEIFPYNSDLFSVSFPMATSIPRVPDNRDS
jgi:hypothetical protein